LNNIAQSPFWKTEIQQIEIISSEDIRLFMRSHDCVVKIGNLENYDYKLRKLEQFYKKGFSQVGWEKYETIDLQYSNQVVCKKKENYGE
jgi:cell division protein FtsQ